MSLLIDNILTPVVLCFLMGKVARWLKAILRCRRRCIRGFPKHGNAAS